jgi:hypothetical protein
MPFNPSQELVACPLASGNAEDLGFRIVHGRLDLTAIQHEESIHRCGANPLVTIDKRMIHD